MGKKKANQEQPAYIAELLDRGTVMLQADSREEIADMVDRIPAKTHYAAGAIGKNPTTGRYSLRIDLVRNI